MVRLLELEDPRWLDFVQSQRDATIFHHPAWARVLADCYGYRALAVALTDGGGAVTAGSPIIEVRRPLGGRRWVSLPFTDSCPSLGAAHRSELVSSLVEIAAARKLDAVELRASLPEAPSLQTSASFVRHELILSADSRLAWPRLSTNHRRNVGAAQRAGVRIVNGGSASDIETFYRLHVETRRRLGVPIQPRRFFDLLLERVIRPGLGFVLSAYSEDRPVAAAVFGAWNGTLTFKYGARDERWAKLGANHLLMWTAIRWASENGYHALDLGRTNVEQSSLRRFKSGWGAQEEPLAYSWVASAPIAHSSHRLENAMAIVIRNSGPWVCRALGELFYRYAA